MLQGERRAVGFHLSGCDNQCMRLLHIPLVSNPTSGQKDPTSCPTCSVGFLREMLPNKPQNYIAAAPAYSHMEPIIWVLKGMEKGEHRALWSD